MGWFFLVLKGWWIQGWCELGVGYDGMVGLRFDFCSFIVREVKNGDCEGVIQCGYCIDVVVLK